MSQTHPLLIERDQHVLSAKSIQRKADLEKRDLSADEVAKVDKHLAEAASLKARWEAEPQPRKTKAALGDPFGGGSVPSFRTGLIGTDGGSFADRLFGAQTATDGFSSYGEWLECVASDRFDTRLRAANREGVDSEGGFLTPAVYRNIMLDAALEQSVLARRVRVFKMSSNELSLSGFRNTDHSSGTFFGDLSATWGPELGTLSEQDTESRRVKFNAKKLTILARASNELLADASDYESMLGSGIAQAMAWELDRAILAGTGAGRPLGCLNSGSKIEVSKESGQTADTIWYVNVVKMFARLHPASYKNAVWVANPTCIPQLMMMDMHADTVGSNALVGDFQYPAFREANGKFTLFGRPVELTEKAPVLGDAGDISLIDPTAYGLALRQDVTLERSGHAGFTTDSTYFRARMRCDGRPLWQDPVTPYQGDSLSWCVTLAERD